LKTNSYASDLILLLAAVIWGFAFVAQRVGMDHVGPFTYTGVRFALGTVVLLPFLWVRLSKNKAIIRVENRAHRGKLITGMVLTGLFLFGGVTFQQLGLQTTSAGKAGFITGLYVVFIPFAGLFFGQRSGLFIWIGAVLSIIGLYFLSMTGEFRLSPGDQLVFWCAVMFTFHVLFIAWLSPLMDSFLLAVMQFAITAVLSLMIAFAIEPVELSSIADAWIPIAYGGLLSVGVAYTLQVVAQQTAHPAYASIILSLEAVFAVLGGWLILNETLTPRMFMGCALMMAGMVLVQLKQRNG
jgi:drug/metabolite transporter (DMT)-like permease